MAGYLLGAGAALISYNYAMAFFRKRLPDLLLLASNLAVLFLSGGDGRVFLIAVVTAITLRYLFLTGLIFLDWLRPGGFAGSRLRRLTMDPDEGGAYYGGGAETPVLGHFVFIAMFNYFPLVMILSAFDKVPLSASYPYIIWTSAAVALRDIAAGRVIYFRSGAGQQKNASWNFTQVLALMVALVTLPGAALLGGVLYIVAGAAMAAVGRPLQSDYNSRVMLWLLSAWLICIFHTLLFLQDSERKETA